MTTENATQINSSTIDAARVMIREAGFLLDEVPGDSLPVGIHNRIGQLQVELRQAAARSRMEAVMD